MSVTIPGVCRACKKDLANARFVKSPKGFFFCEACALAARQKAAAKSASFVSPPPLSPAPVPRLPDVCPNCGTPVIGSRRLCIKCHRDVTKMDKIVTARAARNKTDTEESIGNAVGRAIRITFMLLLIGIGVFLAYGGWLMFHPPGPFDDYPTSRAQAVRQMLNDIALGTDVGYENAFRLISTRIRQTSNPHEADRYKMVYIHMHDDFLRKYGPDWPAKAKIESEEPGSSDEIVPFVVTLNEDQYHIQSQAQMSVSSAVENIMTHEDFPENGKRHFGIRDIEEYSLLPKPKIDPKLQQMIQQMKAMHDKNR